MIFNSRLTLDEQRQEIQKVLQPISEEAPSGANVRIDAEQRDTIRGIESLFKSAIAAERKVEQYRLFPSDSPPDDPNWREFLGQSEEFLATKSKDLMLATIVAEAGLRELGIRGLLLGIELMNGLIDTYWPNVFPTQDSDPSINRITAFKNAYDWPDRVALRLEILTRMTSAGTTFADYNEALKLDDPLLQPEIREERIKKGAKTTEKIREEIRQREVFLTTLYTDLLECRVALEKLTELTRNKCVSADQAKHLLMPDFSRVVDGITRMIASVKTIATPGLLPGEKDSVSSTESSETQTSDSAVNATGIGGNHNPRSGQLTRDAAFTQLTQLANFFRQTEPHSPVSYAIEQAVRWGKMPLPELMSELITNQDSRRTLFERTGLPISASETE